MTTLNEFYVNADLQSLNAELDVQGIQSADIVAILDVPATTLITPKAAQLRVIYHKATG